MKLVIEIPEETYNEVRHYGLNLCPRDREALEKAFKTCKPLPDVSTIIEKNDSCTIKPKLYKAKIKDTDKYVTGAYYCYPKTTYCFTEDYNKFPVEDEHIIITHHMTDWGLPNEIRAYKIDVNTLQER